MKTMIKFLEEYERQYTEKEEKGGPIITVSGFAGSGKSTVADWTAKAVHLKRFSCGSIFRNIAKEEGITLDELSRTRGDEVDHLVEKKALKKGLKGGIVIDGRIAGWVFGEWADFKILVKCPTEVRAERISRRDRLDEKEAYMSVKGRDENDRQKYLDLYGIDILSEEPYDLIIDNSGTMEELKRQVDLAVDLIISKLSK